MKLNVCMSRQSFTRLCWLIQGFMSPEEETVRNPIPLIMRVTVVLYKLGSCAEYRVVANQFGVHKSTVKKSVYIFCKGMMNRPILDLIRMQGEMETSEIGNRTDDVEQSNRFNAFTWHYIYLVRFIERFIPPLSNRLKFHSIWAFLFRLRCLYGEFSFGLSF